MRALVTGGARLLGSHLCASSLKSGDSVVCVDDLPTGRQSNKATVADDPKFSFSYFAMPMGIFTSAEAARSALHLAGRFLLMVSMTLFLSYLLFMLGAVVVSGILSTARSLRKRPGHDVPAASASPQPDAPLWHVESAADRHQARV